MALTLSTVKSKRHYMRQPQLVRRMRSDPPLLFWRRVLDQAVDEAMKTSGGLPTDLAILARWWISDLRPLQSDKDEWERSFECACHWLDLDPIAERKRLLSEIDLSLQGDWMQAWYLLTYTRRAMVLTCSGVPTAIAKQFFLPLASLSTYDEVAGVEKPDMFAELEPLEPVVPLSAYASVWPQRD
jgi:hypothetical protein